MTKPDWYELAQAGQVKEAQAALQELNDWADTWPGNIAVELSGNLNTTGSAATQGTR